MHYDEFKKILDEIKFTEKIYEIARFIDPISKKVLIYKNSAFTIEENCYSFWNKDRQCANCISIRAFNENETFIKIECSKEKIYILIATPAVIGNKKIVIELIKDITDSLVFESNKKYNIESEIYSLIQNLDAFSLKDTLTGVYNRRYVNEKLPLNIYSANILEQNLSVIITDIDYFKNVNDTYGHLAGDIALKYFAETLSECLKRDSDWIARFGGDEFLICLPNSNTENAIEIAERMRKLIEGREIIYNDKTIKITASFGISVLKHRSNVSLDDLIFIADKKLYLAKNKGRNRIEF